MEELKNYVVYKHTSPTGKVYIGVTQSPAENRWKDGFGYNSNYLFFIDIVKYGWDNFKHEILFDNLTKDEAFKKEDELITNYKLIEPQYGYNIMGSNITRSNIIRQRISEGMPKIAVEQYTLYGEYIATFISTREAYRQTGIRNDYISRACKTGKPLRGFIWKYAKNA